MPYLRTVQQVELRNLRDFLMHGVRCDYASSEIHTLATHASSGTHLHGVPVSPLPSHPDRGGEASLLSI